MKIQKITLKDTEIREIDGEFELVSFNEKTYPIFLTNYSVKKGKEMGLIEGSLVKDLFMAGTESDEELGEQFNENKMLSIIYAAFIGVNRGVGLSFDEFLDKYHGTFVETMELYNGLLEGLSDKPKNNFVAGLEKSTSPKKQNEKK